MELTPASPLPERRHRSSVLHEKRRNNRSLKKLLHEAPLTYYSVSTHRDGTQAAIYSIGAYIAGQCMKQPTVTRAQHY
eukprot:5790462-Amphidinium_carterae.1